MSYDIPGIFQYNFKALIHAAIKILHTIKDMTFGNDLYLCGYKYVYFLIDQDIQIIEIFNKPPPFAKKYALCVQTKYLPTQN